MTTVMYNMETCPFRKPITIIHSFAASSIRLASESLMPFLDQPGPAFEPWSSGEHARLYEVECPPHREGWVPGRRNQTAKTTKIAENRRSLLLQVASDIP
jgi:hypothetical protein